MEREKVLAEVWTSRVRVCYTKNVLMMICRCFLNRQDDRRRILS